MQRLQKTRGVLVIMVNQVLETSYPPSSPHSVSLRLCRCCIFYSPYTLPSSVSRKSFARHSYANSASRTILRDENCRGVYQQFPFWNSARLSKRMRVRPLAFSSPMYSICSASDGL